MSHFSLHVLTPRLKDVTLDGVEAQVARLMAPFDERIDAAPHNKPCFCVGSKARSDARVAAIAKFGTIDSLQLKFREQFPELAKISYFDPGTDEETREKASETWRSRFTKPLQDAEDAAFEAHPLKATAEAECEDCKGSGTIESTYNEKSKWDWYVVGGRWNGGLRGIDPADDKENWKVCDLCDGTGKRTDMEVANGCNGCSGKGQMLKYPSDQKDAGNWLPLSEFAPRLSKENCPFAVLTPDGEWIERGQMGWFGMVGDEKKKGVWIEQVATIYARYPESILVLIDCHI